MKSLTIGIILITVYSTGLSAADQTEGQWTLAQDKQEVKVYVRKVEGTGIKAFRGVMRCRASLSSLVALVSDAESHPDWLANCSQSQLLKRVSPRETYVYSLSKAPWPVTDRDTIIHNLICQDQTTGVVTIKQTAKPDYIEAKKKITRVKRMQGFWQFTPHDDGYVEIVYQAISDPGGNIPVWLINASLVSQPFDTLSNMATVIKREKYQKARLDFIREPQHNEVGVRATD